MTKSLILALTVLTLASVESPAGIVERAEATELRRTNGMVVPRVVRNEDGRVVRLLLSEMAVSRKEVEEIGELGDLRALVLFRTSLTDQDLVALRRCEKLEHLNLTGTEVTDAAIGTILTLENLKSVCLGNVKIAPQAIERLKA